MKVAISNIAWPVANDEDVAALLTDCGVRGIEIAPGKLASDSPLPSIDEVRAYREAWEGRGFRIVAAQALLFGRPDLKLFASEAIRKATLDHLSQIISLCAAAGAGPLVFGAPKNRQRGEQPASDVIPVATAFFRELAEQASSRGCTIALEANPEAYGCDFVTTAFEAIDLVRRVDHPGLRLHLDCACMTLAGDSIREAVSNGVDILAHCHVAEPQLRVIEGDDVDHLAFSQVLVESGYSGWVSMEMREPQPFDLNRLKRSVQFVRRVYGDLT